MCDGPGQARDRPCTGPRRVAGVAAPDFMCAQLCYVGWSCWCTRLMILPVTPRACHLIRRPVLRTLVLVPRLLLVQHVLTLMI